MNRKNSIRLHIERLVVDEPLIAAGQAAALQAVIETELSRLLEAGGFIEFRDSSAAILNADSVHVSGKSVPASFGRQIAQSIHGALKPANAAMRQTQTAAKRRGWSKESIFDRIMERR